METTSSEKEIFNRFSILPQEIKDLFSYNVVSSVVNELGNTHKLNREQKELLQNEIIFTLLLFLPKNDFAKRVAESLEVEKSVVETISNKIDLEIFSLVEEILESANSAMGKVERTNFKTETIRTFEDDMKNIHGYGFMPKEEAGTDSVVKSSQDDIFTSKKNDTSDHSTT